MIKINTQLITKEYAFEVPLQQDVFSMYHDIEKKLINRIINLNNCKEFFMEEESEMRIQMINTLLSEYTIELNIVKKPIEVYKVDDIEMSYDEFKNYCLSHNYDCIEYTLKTNEKKFVLIDTSTNEIINDVEKVDGHESICIFICKPKNKKYNIIINDSKHLRCAFCKKEFDNLEEVVLNGSDDVYRFEVCEECKNILNDVYYQEQTDRLIKRMQN